MPTPQPRPHALVRRFTPHFNPASQANGWRYAVRGRVRLVHADSRQVDATVRGTRVYDVRIALQGTNIVLSCTCPRYMSGFNCKHIWATLVVAEGKRHLADLALFPDGELGLGSVGEPEPDSPSTPSPAARSIRWRDVIHSLHSLAPGAAAATDRQLAYQVNLSEANRSGRFILQILARRKMRQGGWGRPAPYRVRPGEADLLPDRDDRAILQLVLGGRTPHPLGWNDTSSEYVLNDELIRAILPRVCATGRFHVLVDAQPEATPCGWDSGAPWNVRLQLKTSKDGSQLLGGHLERGQERMDLAEVQLILASGFLIAKGKAARYVSDGAWPWILALRQGPIRISRSDVGAFVEELHAAPGPIPIDLPEALRPRELRVAPTFRLRISTDMNRGFDRLRPSVTAALWFDYGPEPIAASDPRPRVLKAGQLILRDAAAEAGARRVLTDELEFRHPAAYRQDPEIDFEFPASKLSTVVDALSTRGWIVEADGAVYRRAEKINISVTSGVDWFDLAGGVNFGRQVVPFPRLLKALKSGEQTIRLDDGSVGILPQEWLTQRGLVLEAGETAGDSLRFKGGQALLLDALLAAEPTAISDKPFQQFRAELRRFNGVRLMNPPAGFKGTLRPYQRAGLGWMAFLRKFGFGGCLADDMGLGKTVQVLALLESRREEKAGPSLVVMPRSLIFNWKAEAARFTPELRIVDNTGVGRSVSARTFKDCDIALTTYGTLRRDAPLLKDITFDYVILDEAQAIKNSSAVTAKAARLLKGKHRLALSGTPIENHIGELWSLMEFLNPGMLGRATVFRDAIEGRGEAAGSNRPLLAQALRPFMLRRTKEQVAPELPKKTEQTIRIDLEGPERKKYDELRMHYRKTLLQKGKDLDRNKMNVLEALLRLRQAACHPGLIDPALGGEPSSKLTMLLERVREVIEEGHKVLVFSQFTTLLAIVRRQLDQENLKYEYLDGQTRDREAKVRRFQTDPACPIFLISLKAGGVGLNLTAAEYVFLLDPWWNPAVEAQAIDRTHRIGQERPVFAYRLVARDTVEEKVIELQKAKRALADAILTEDRSLLKDLSREDLALLLS